MHLLNLSHVLFLHKMSIKRLTVHIHRSELVPDVAGVSGDLHLHTRWLWRPNEAARPTGAWWTCRAALIWLFMKARGGCAIRGNLRPSQHLPTCRVSVPGLNTCHHIKVEEEKSLR